MTAIFVKSLKWSLLGAALIGSRDKSLNVVQSAMEHLYGGADLATVPIIGGNRKLTLTGSIFALAHQAALYDIDDGHRKAQGHPAAAVIATALCVAYHHAASGTKLLEAIVIGYEVAIRSALVMRKQGGPRKGSGAWTTPGVAAACAHLLDLSEEETKHAIGLAEYYAPHAPQDQSVRFPSMLKEGIPSGAHQGHVAAILAKSGMTAFWRAKGMTAMQPFLDDGIDGASTLCSVTDMKDDDVS